MWGLFSPLGIFQYFRTGNPKGLLLSFFLSIKDRILLPLFVRTNWHLRQTYLESDKFSAISAGSKQPEYGRERDDYWMGTLGFIDRVGVIGIAFVATLSNYHRAVLELDTWSIGLMYFLGRYSSITRDTVDQHEHEEQIRAKKWNYKKKI